MGGSEKNSVQEHSKNEKEGGMCLRYPGAYINQYIARDNLHNVLKACIINMRAERIVVEDILLIWVGGSFVPNRS